MNLLKKGYYLLLVLLLSITVSCDDNEDGIDTIKGMDFNIATLNSKGNKVGVLPVSAFGNGSIVYTVDFGAVAEDDTDEFRTSGPLVTYDYPEETATYTITVTGSLDGVSDVSITKEHTVTYSVVVAPPVGGGNPLLGVWKFAPEAGAFGVGPEKENVGWFSSGIDDVTKRACIFDDEYVFNADGTFQNVVGTETFVEKWQGVAADACGTPVFPHDGTATATYTYDETAGTIKIEGKGAYLGLPKVVNLAELTAPGDAPDEITYIAVLNGDVLDIDIEVGGGGFWSYKLVREPAPSIVGTWKFAPEAGAFGVGPEKENVGWFSSGIDDVTKRACIFDDEYVFNADGTFQNVVGTETFVEKWQGVAADACGTPVFPHDGTATATYTYDETAGTIKIEGKGAYLGLPKVVNLAELTAPGDAPDEITYIAVLNGDVLDIDIEVGGGGFWSYKLVRE